MKRENPEIRSFANSAMPHCQAGGGGPNGPELDDACLDALAPEDDYEPHPEPGDFYLEQDAA